MIAFAAAFVVSSGGGGSDPKAAAATAPRSRPRRSSWAARRSPRRARLGEPALAEGAREEERNQLDVLVVVDVVHPHVLILVDDAHDQTTPTTQTPTHSADDADPHHPDHDHAPRPR